jgi:hypothetical protein
MGLARIEMAQSAFRQAAQPEIREKESLMDSRFEATVGAGTMMAGSGAAARFPHWWTPGGVTVEADFAGGHLLHLAAGGCVLNDLYREAVEWGIELKGVRVIAADGFRCRDVAVHGNRLFGRGHFRCPRRSACSLA